MDGDVANDSFSGFHWIFYVYTSCVGFVALALAAYRPYRGLREVLGPPKVGLCG